ncbi:phosphopantothenoylcysteine decarboxylase/phosphopantothenate-cysteine ligase [Olsenella sp. oral taxon 809 str. F0356]|uniref:bifunctional phosphopantothenoylcysteine decarboxylase/phosphopantothenate--cysteine ligase CoaBC n=1 Tax=Olsenella sp. oral taxon 809 TaxID=661086 RepID=UPI000231EEB1|nr:bifunctional phosphopantothenoylcysteine decarboxylase/phosphopantothenate--cysteine ligase CoaBC [Olsenella sp. oral taxon 809]EHF01930.1 phosphopantothenoylcysteine decarboxylase/phosphopantothenate-cysteine ligase [Olsenella sp. oral taxon 809 str. F0356]
MRSSRVLLAVCGGIAAYKAVELMRGLQKAGCDVRVVMSEDATRFVGPTTFEALSGHPVTTNLYGSGEGPIPHVELADFAELAVVVPATANVMAKMAAGMADDALSTTLLALGCPVLVAPAMNLRMWQAPATQANLATLRSRGVRFVMPDSGRLACGAVGTGKLAPVGQVLAAALDLLGGEARDLEGLSLVVTAGPTHEAIDPVRYIANASSGKMGFALAREAARRGASVTLVAGPVSLPTPEGVRRVDVVSAAQMHDAALAAFDGADVAVCAAAVADYTPAEPADHKLKKAREPLDSIRLVRTADVLAELCARKGRRVVVGFAAETDELVPNARAKLRAKGADLIVANDVSRADSTFGSETDAVTLVDASGELELPCLPKDEVARRVMDRVRELALPRDQG